MANFALSGPIFKIQNSKSVYSKNYKQPDKFEKRSSQKSLFFWFGLTDENFESIPLKLRG